MKVNLFYNHYTDAARQSEIDYCMRMNKKVFDRTIVVKGRPSFNILFKMMDEYPEDINVICNSDIYFPDISLLKKIQPGECYALTRWNLEDGELSFFNRNDSQDSWIFHGSPQNINAPFTMGMWGCDNRLAYEIVKAGYKLSNPSLSIVTVHVHEIDGRNYKRTKENTVQPPWLTVLPPCQI